MPKANREANPEGRMSLIEHLRELRSRLLRAVVAIVVGVAVGWFLFDPVWTVLKQPYCELPQSRALGPNCNLFAMGIFDQFFIHLKVALAIGLLASCPAWLYQLWAFVAPGLHRNERRWTYAFMGTSVPLFLAGGALAYLVLDRGLAIFLSYFALDDVTALITPDAYLGYALTMLLAFGLGFELPLFVVILNFAGVLTHERIVRWRSWIIFLIFVFAAIVTPDVTPISMLALGIPILVLFEVAELIALVHDRRKARRGSLYSDLSDDEASPLEDDDEPEPALSDGDRHVDR
jgi:sec-independent protein translocase protein TatC